MVRYILYRIDIMGKKWMTFLNLGIIGLLWGILFYDKITFPYKEWVTVFLIIVFFLTLFLILISKLLVNFIFLKTSNDLPKTHSIEYNCQFINDNGSLFTQVTFNQTNLSIHPQRTIINDFEGFCFETNFFPSYNVINRTEHGNIGKIEISGYDKEVILRAFKEYSDPNKNVFQADWAVLLDPPLLPNEKIKYIRTAINNAIYKNALLGEKTEFSFRPRVPCRVMKILIIPPINFIFNDIKIITDNQQGERVHIPYIFSKNSFKIISNCFVWEIPLPGIILRHKVEFTLRPI